MGLCNLEGNGGGGVGVIDLASDAIPSTGQGSFTLETGKRYIIAIGFHVASGISYRGISNFEVESYTALITSTSVSGGGSGVQVFVGKATGENVVVNYDLPWSSMRCYAIPIK